MTNMIRFTPSREMRNLQREIDRVFEGFFGEEEEGNKTAVWTPRVDLAETDEEYRIHLDIPGVNKEDIKINYHDGSLTVSGERAHSTREETENMVRVERSRGHFYRSFTLPKAADAENIKAETENGVLTIRVPKTPESKPRQIEVH